MSREFGFRRRHFFAGILCVFQEKVTKYERKLSGRCRSWIIQRFLRKPMTDKAVDLLMDELDGLTHDTGEKVKILNRSVVNGWSGIYPLDGGEKNRKSVPADPIPQYGIVL